METNRKKDILGNIKSIAQIDQYFSFTKKHAFFRHLAILTLYSFSALMIVLSVFLRLGLGAKVTTIFCITISFLIVGRMVFLKDANYRFIVYCFTVIGIIFMILSAHLLNSVLLILYIAYAVIVMVDFLTIENSLYRGMSPVLRMNKKANFEKFGYDKIDEM